MKKIFLNNLKSIYNNYKYEKLIFHSVSTTQPKNEKLVSLIIFLGFTVWTFFRLFLPSFIVPYEAYANVLGFYIIFPIMMYLLYKSANREMKNVITYYQIRKGNNLNLVQKRYIFTYTFIKTIKPVVQACILCGGLLYGVDAGGFKHFYPDAQTPGQQLAKELTKYTGYPPDSWKLPEVKAREEIEALKEQLQNQEIQHNQELEKLRKDLMKEIERRNSRWW